VEGYNLTDWLKSTAIKKSERELIMRPVLVQILEALYYLHS